MGISAMIGLSTAVGVSGSRKAEKKAEKERKKQEEIMKKKEAEQKKKDLAAQAAADAANPYSGNAAARRMQFERMQLDKGRGKGRSGTVRRRFG